MNQTLWDIVWLILLSIILVACVFIPPKEE